jgi:nitrite reductase/ring-hydroxylating ferredoxin subunit
MRKGTSLERDAAWSRSSPATTRDAPLAEASTIPAPWYVDARIAELERLTVFSKTWQVMGRVDQVAKPGQFVTATVAGEPLVAVRGNDGVLRAFYNVCRHHAAAVVTERVRARIDSALSVSRLELWTRWHAQGHA